MIKVGIDIGNSKISCIVCDIKNFQNPKVLSFVSLPTSNINKGNINNFELIKQEVKEIIELAAKESQTEIKSINLNVPLSGSNSFFFKSQIDIENELINELHLNKAINKSEFFNETINKYTLINLITYYEIDKKIITGSPIGNYAKTLDLNFYKILVDQNMISTYENLFNQLNIHISHFIPSPLSSALATLNDDDKELGGILIDLGHSSTSISVYEKRKLIFCDSINIGSKNITNDIARGISTTKESAERLKTLYGSVLSSQSDEYEIIEVPLITSEENQYKKINRSTINSIIKPRVEETLELVWQKLKEFEINKKRIKNVILTGGGSQLEGIADYAQIIFDSNVRLGKPKAIIGLNKKHTGPQFSQTIGSIFYQKREFEIDFLKKSLNSNKKTLLGRFSAWLDRYI